MTGAGRSGFAVEQIDQVELFAPGRVGADGFAAFDADAGQRPLAGSAG